MWGFGLTIGAILFTLIGLVLSFGGAGGDGAEALGYIAMVLLIIGFLFGIISLVQIIKKKMRGIVFSIITLAIDALFVLLVLINRFG